jgi:hypothetical protein
MTLHDDDACKTATFSRDVLPHEWISREGRFAASLPRKLGTEKTKVAGIRPASVSPQLRDAILGLHRNDPLRRTYLRHCWTRSSELLNAQINDD